MIDEAPDSFNSEFGEAQTEPIPITCGRVGFSRQS